MIAKYLNKYFCVDTAITPMRIWAYIPVEGFDLKTTRRGTVFYEKYVDVAVLDEIFDVGFSVKWNGRWCGANPRRDGKTVNLLLGWGDGSFAREHGFYEIEKDRGMVVAWGLDIDIDTCEEFRMTIWQKHPSKEELESILPKEEWLEMYKKTVADLIPKRN